MLSDVIKGTTEAVHPAAMSIFLFIKNTSNNKYNFGVASSGIDIVAKFHKN
jgi:hypothetical protein